MAIAYEIENIWFGRIFHATTERLKCAKDETFASAYRASNRRLSTHREACHLLSSHAQADHEAMMHIEKGSY